MSSNDEHLLDKFALEISKALIQCNEFELVDIPSITYRIAKELLEEKRKIVERAAIIV